MSSSAIHGGVRAAHSTLLCFSRFGLRYGSSPQPAVKSSAVFGRHRWLAPARSSCSTAYLRHCGHNRTSIPSLGVLDLSSSGGNGLGKSTSFFSPRVGFATTPHCRQVGKEDGNRHVPFIFTWVLLVGHVHVEPANPVQDNHGNKY